jgi:hypothetical protein
VPFIAVHWFLLSFLSSFTRTHTTTMTIIIILNAVPSLAFQISFFPLRFVCGFCLFSIPIPSHLNVNGTPTFASHANDKFRKFRVHLTPARWQKAENKNGKWKKQNKINIKWNLFIAFCTVFWWMSERARWSDMQAKHNTKWIMQMHRSKQFDIVQIKFYTFFPVHPLISMLLSGVSDIYLNLLLLYLKIQFDSCLVQLKIILRIKNCSCCLNIIVYTLS